MKNSEGSQKNKTKGKLPKNKISHLSTGMNATEGTCSAREFASSLSHAISSMYTMGSLSRLVTRDSQRTRVCVNFASVPSSGFHRYGDRDEGQMRQPFGFSDTVGVPSRFKKLLKEEGKPAYIILHPSSHILESTTLCPTYILYYTDVPTFWSLPYGNSAPHSSGPACRRQTRTSA